MVLWFHDLSYKPPLSTGRPQKALPRSFSSPGWTTPAIPACPHREVLQPQPSSQPSSGLTPTASCSTPGEQRGTIVPLDLLATLLWTGNISLMQQTHLMAWWPDPLSQSHSSYSRQSLCPHLLAYGWSRLPHALLERDGLKAALPAGIFSNSSDFSSFCHGEAGGLSPSFAALQLCHCSQQHWAAPLPCTEKCSWAWTGGIILWLPLRCSARWAEPFSSCTPQMAN